MHERKHVGICSTTMTAKDGYIGHLHGVQGEKGRETGVFAMARTKLELRHTYIHPSDMNVFFCRRRRRQLETTTNESMGFASFFFIVALIWLQRKRKKERERAGYEIQTHFYSMFVQIHCRNACMCVGTVIISSAFF